MPTIQGEVELSLYRLTGEWLRIVGAGRTDAGVHARGQVVSFSTGAELALESLVGGLNFYLPLDIAVSAAYRVSDDFDARRCALSREYRYTVFNSRARSSWERGHAFQVVAPLDIGAMDEACRLLVGRRDFAPFAGPVAGGGTVRSMFRAEVGREGKLVFFDLVADSFLPQQVRRTVGALLRVGTGRMGVEEFRGMADSGVAGLAKEAAPARGLCLVRVEYPAAMGLAVNSGGAAGNGCVQVSGGSADRERPASRDPRIPGGTLR